MESRKARLPSVNFHSIEDLIRPSSSGKSNGTDGGIQHSPIKVHQDVSNEIELPNTPLSKTSENVISPSMGIPRNGGEIPVSPPKSDDKIKSVLVDCDVTMEPKHKSCQESKKGRTIYKAQQVYVLEHIFQRTHYPDPEVIETLSRDLNIAENKIKVWFQNKRARWRRRVNDRQQSDLSPTPAGHNISVITSPPPVVMELRGPGGLASPPFMPNAHNWSPVHEASLFSPQMRLQFHGDRRQLGPSMPFNAESAGSIFSEGLLNVNSGCLEDMNRTDFQRFNGHLYTQNSYSVEQLRKRAQIYGADNLRLSAL